MLIADIGLIDHRDRLLKTRLQGFRQQFFPQRPEQQQLSDVISIPFLKGNLLVAVPVDESRHQRLHRLLNDSPDHKADDDFQFLVLGRNSVGDVIVQNFVQRRSQRLDTSIPFRPFQVAGFHGKKEQSAIAVFMSSDGSDVDAALSHAYAWAGDDVEADLAQKIRQDRIEFSALFERPDVVGKQEFHFGLLDRKTRSNQSRPTGSIV